MNDDHYPFAIGSDVSPVPLRDDSADLPHAWPGDIQITKFPPTTEDQLRDKIASLEAELAKAADKILRLKKAVQEL